MLVQIGSSGALTCDCNPCLRWKLYVKGELPGGPTWRQYEVWTQCYIQALAAYLRHAHTLASPVILLLAGTDSCWQSCAAGVAALLLWLCAAPCRQRAADFNEPSLKVLEVGGGDGRLTAYLKDVLANAREGLLVTVVCTDSGTGGLHSRSPFRCAPPILCAYFAVLLFSDAHVFSTGPAPQSPEGAMLVAC